MDNAVKLPVIAGVEITTDAEGRFNLNALHRASGLGEHKKPSEWLRSKQAQELACELSGNSRLGQNVINSVKGGISPGTFAHELLAISYAGWISPAFQLKVNQVFLDYRSGKLSQPVVPQSLPEALRLAAELAEEKERLEAEAAANAPKIAFANQVEVAPDAITIAKAAKILDTGRNRLLAILRKNGWVNRRNEPYQVKIEAGLLDVKLGEWHHPDHGLQQSVTTLVTGKGLTKIRGLIEDQKSPA